MPVRLVCPSCSAALSVKDEYAGRAVKCPKCGGVIPPGQPAAAPPPSKPSAALPPPPPPEPEPERPLFEEIDDEPAAPKIKGRPSGKPAPRVNADDDDAPPPKRRSRRDDDDEEDDRPARSRRPRDVDDEDDRPRGKKKSKTPLILGIVGFLLLTCCLSGVYGVYWFFSKAKEVVEKVQDDLEKADLRVNRANYDRLKVGTTTRAEVEQILGAGKIMSFTDLKDVFPSDPQAVRRWTPLANRGRVLVWRSGDATVLAAFYPEANDKGLLQMKQWQPKAGAGNFAGEPDDAKFAKNPPAGGGGPPVTAKTKLTVEDLVREFKADPAAAAARYNDKVFLVSGNLSDIKVTAGGQDVIVTLEGAGGARVACTMVSYSQYSPFNYDRGQQLEFEVRCFGLTGGVVTLKYCADKDKEAGKSLAEKASAQQLLAAYRTAAAGDAKYKGKWVEVDGQVAKLMSDGTIFLAPQAAGSGSKPPDIKIRVDYDPSYQVLLTKSKMKVGDRVRVKGVCKGIDGGEIAITDGWVSLSYLIQNN